MLTLDIVRHHISVMIALFLGQRQAIRSVDASYEGFWRSFAAILVVLPVYALYVAAEYRLLLADGTLGEDAGAGGYILTRLIGLGVDWIAYPVLIFAVAAPLGIARQAPLYITAYNWSNVVISIPLAIPAILYGFGLINSGLATVLVLVGLIIFARLRYMIARTALDARVDMAVGLVIFDFLLGLSLAEVTSRLTGY